MDHPLIEWFFKAAAGVAATLAGWLFIRTEKSIQKAADAAHARIAGVEERLNGAMIERKTDTRDLAVRLDGKADKEAVVRQSVLIESMRGDITSGFSELQKSMYNQHVAILNALSTKADK